MSDGRKLRIAIVGLRHGSTYVPHVRRHARTDLAALVDIDARLLGDLSAACGVPGFAGVAEMLAAGVADAAILAVPTRYHAEASEACLDAGLHVLQEKPLCRNEDEARRIGRAVDRNAGRVFQVGFEMRSSPLHRAILDHIARGDLGRVTNLWYHQHTNKDAGFAGTWRAQRDEMGGMLFDCAVHTLDLMQQWAGSRVCRLAAIGNVLGETGPCAEAVPLSAAIAMEYANGVRGTYNFGGCNQLHDDASFGVVGTTGRIMGTPWLPEKAGSYELRTHGGLRKGTLAFDGELTSRGHLGFGEQFDSFVAACLAGGPNVCPFPDAYAVQRTMQAIDRSLTSGEVVTLD